MSDQINEAVEKWCAVPSELVDGREKMLARAKFCRAITSADGMQRAITLAGDMKRMAKGVEERRRELLRPLEDATKRFNAAMKGVTDPLLLEVRRIETLAGEWKRQKPAIQAPPGIGTLISYVPPAPQVIRKVENASIQSTWDFEITDAWALAQHDRSAVEISVRRSVVSAWIRAGAREIPGCRVFEVTKVTAR